MIMQLIDYLNCSSQCISTEVKNLSTKLKTRNLNKNFNILMLNIRSIRGNFNALTAMLDTINHHFSIIILNEVWLDPGEEHHFEINNYHTYGNCRNRNGGGVVIYCSRLLEARVRSELTVMSPILESLFIEVKLRSQSLVIGTVYRPPSSHNLREFSLLLQAKILSKVPDENFLVCGDLNINLRSDITNANMTFVNIMLDKNLTNYRCHKRNKYYSLNS